MYPAYSREPLLIVRADQLYDFRLLRKIADAPFTRDLDAFALVIFVLFLCLVCV